MAATERVRMLAFTLEDINALRDAVEYTLDTEIKTGQHKKRSRLFNLQRRLYRARQELEK
jgi:hypothetical protein